MYAFPSFKDPEAFRQFIFRHYLFIKTEFIDKHGDSHTFTFIGLLVKQLEIKLENIKVLRDARYALLASASIEYTLRFG